GSAQLARVDLAQIAPIEEDPPRVRLVNAQQQLDAGRLAGPARTYKRKRLFGLQAERDVVERRRLASVIADRDPVDLQNPAGEAKRFVSAGRRLLGLVEQLEHALRAGRGAERAVV